MKNNLWYGRIVLEKKHCTQIFKNYEVNCLFPVIHCFLRRMP